MFRLNILLSLGFSDWMKESLEMAGLKGAALLLSISGGWGESFSDFLSSIETRRRPGIKFNEDSDQIAPLFVNEVPVQVKSSNNDHGYYNDFIRKMVSIRDVLRVAGCEDAINLPSIVVVGSQSSGKSSVLECLVGHEFLPKGQNMVTRRPLELTLVHSPQESEDYVIIQQYDGKLKIRDFSKVQAILKDLNLSVPDGEWISSDPIQVTICSPNVPDLTLIDLPGYIQVNSRDQPPILRDKIRQLCDSYIKRENLILAVCAADVDLANSEALKASRRHDPHGERTIGVITKMDLVDAGYAAGLVENQDYPLKLGYIAVICKSGDGGNVSGHKALPSTLQNAVEREYFAQNQQVFGSISDRIGFAALRSQMTASLEAMMGNSLKKVVRSVESELDELKYQLKAQFNDQFVSSEAYVTDLITTIKRDFSQLARQFTRAHIDTSLRGTFNTRLVQLFDSQFWSKDASNEAADQFAVLNNGLSSFTRSGVGRFTTSLISVTILAEIERILSRPPLTFHSNLHAKITDAAESFLQSKCQAAMEQVENSMKPFKQGIEFTPRDWKEARENLLCLLEAENLRLQRELNDKRLAFGSAKKLKRAVEVILSREIEGNAHQSGSNSILLKADEIVQLNAKHKRLQSRLSQLKGKGSQNLQAIRDYRNKIAWSTRIRSLFLGSPDNNARDLDRNLVYEVASASVGTSSPSNENNLTIFRDPVMYENPEIYLYMVMDRFLRTCSTFVHYELISEFLFPFPDHIISSGGLLSLARMTPSELRALLEENPEISSHLKMQERFRALQEALKQLKQMHSRNGDARQ